MSRMRAGGLFVGVFLAIGAFNSITGLLKGSSSDAQATVNHNSAPVSQDTVPEQYVDLVNEWGNLCPELSPGLLAAQLSQESGWRPDAQSSASAQGIAQFIPSTWAAHGFDANGDGTADVWDPEDAIPSGATYNCTVAGYVKDVPGDPVDNMLAAYNAGPDAVREYNGVPPYSETQNYIRIIRGAADQYES